MELKALLSVEQYPILAGREIDSETCGCHDWKLTVAAKNCTCFVEIYLSDIWHQWK
jgi:hypothetical protein